MKSPASFFPLGSPTYDLCGADRKGANLFGNCLLALDARTAKRIWHFQAVHHNLWDYDLTTAPKLVKVKHNGQMVDVVAQASKSGFLYVFNRATGEPLWPIEERPAPQTDVPGEESWPFSTKPPPLARQTFTVDDVNPLCRAGGERTIAAGSPRPAARACSRRPPSLDFKSNFLAHGAEVIA